MLTHRLPSFTSTTSIRQYVNAPVLLYQSPCTPVKLQMPDFWHFSHLCYCSALCSSISIDLDRCCLMLLLAIPQAVELSVCTRVAGCGHPISSNVVHSISARLQFSNNAPISASDADERTGFTINVVANMAP